ncbi:MAG: hypothetical protein ACRDEB_00545 [Chitinophagaceae bacterium]
MGKSFFLKIAMLAIISFFFNESHSQQQYKLKQVNNMMGMKTETIIYVKGMRKRTEPGSVMGMPAQPVTIEQCDLQRTIKLNDKKKLYFIEPFSKEEEEVIDEDVKPVTPVKNKPVTPQTTPQKGGVITMWYNIRDTGERKKINGFIARHVWTTQKMKPSPEACTMKDSIIIKTDGWYIDLPQFNCPVHYKPSRSMMSPSEREKPDCLDKFVTRRSGKGKLGFPLSETRTIIMGGKQSSEFTTNFETPEFSSEKLDSMLFEIPPGYTEAINEDQLQEKMNMSDMINQYKNQDADGKLEMINSDDLNNNGQKKEGMIRIGVYPPSGDDQADAASLQNHMVTTLKTGKVDAVAVKSEEEAIKNQCDYTLSSDFIRVKQAGKVGGLLKAIKNADPSASSSFNIEASQKLIKLSDHSTRLEPKINGKFDGQINDAAEKALDDGCRQVLKELK